jgi:hypothetical protein
MRYLILGTLVIVIFTFAAREVAAQPRACVRADIAETFVLPDGSQHPAGQLRICLDRDYSPVAGLHTIAADGHATGRFLSRRVKPEVGSPEAPQVAFVRDAAGVLVLRGYTLAHGGRVDAYWMAPARSGAVATASRPTADTVWLAAAVMP